MSNGGEGKVIIEDCLYQNNLIPSFAFGPLIIGSFESKDSVLIKNCNFLNNTEEVIQNFGSTSSGLTLQAGLDSTFLFCEIVKCNFFNNEIYNSGTGAVYIENLNPNESFIKVNLRDCIFEDNRGQDGGGVKITNLDFDGSGIVQSSFSNCLFNGNVAESGEAIFVENFSNVDSSKIDVNIINSTFFDHKANSDFSNEEGVLFNNASKINAQNCIFWNYETENGGYLPLIKNSGFNSSSLNFLQNCLIQEDSCTFDFTVCENNLYNIPPLFQDETTNNFRLQLCSPAISAGNNSFLDSLNLITDFEGNPRIQSGIVDLGAYESPALEISSVIAAADCIENDGSINFDISGGCEPYQISYENNSIDSLQIDSLTSGNYTFTITDAVGKIETIESNIPATESDFVDINIDSFDCETAETGSIVLNPIEGTAPYQFAWENGITDSILINLLPGEYQATVTDHENCIDTISVTILSEGNLNLSPTVSPISCHDSADGTASIIPLNGQAPFQYQWADGQTDSLILNLASGEYSVIVTDAIGCQDDLSFIMLPPDSIVLSLITQHNSCFESNDGQIIIEADGGTGAFSYFWNNASDNDTISQLSAGFYEVVVSDQKDCTATASAEITQPLPLIIDSLITDNNCFGDSTGMIAVQLAGGTAPYFYEWNTGEVDSFLTNLPVGVYEATVFDVNNCTEMIVIDINAPDSISLSAEIINASTSNSENGAINLMNIAGGEAPHHFLWSTGETTQNISELLPDTYFLTITDANNCERIFEFEVSFNSNIFEEKKIIDFLLSPNPVSANDFFQIGTDEKFNHPLNVSIYNAAGKLYETINNIQFGEPIKPPEISGTYFLKIEVGNELVDYVMLVVQ